MDGAAGPRAPSPRVMPATPPRTRVLYGDVATGRDRIKRHRGCAIAGVTVDTTSGEDLISVVREAFASWVELLGAQLRATRLSTERPTARAARSRFRRAQVLMSSANDIEPFDVPRFQAQKNLAVETKGWEYFSPLLWLELNHRVKPLGDVRVRQALSMAIDREFVLKRLWFGTGRVATGPIASTTRFHDPAIKLAAFDPAKAMALLDEAGLKPGPDGRFASTSNI